MVISGAVLGAAALRAALLADGEQAEDFPQMGILVYGGALTVLTALVFEPPYISWQERVIGLRDRLYPIPDNGMPTTE